MDWNASQVSCLPGCTGPVVYGIPKRLVPNCHYQPSKSLRFPLLLFILTAIFFFKFLGFFCLFVCMYVCLRMRSSQWPLRGSHWQPWCYQHCALTNWANRAPQLNQNRLFVLSQQRRSFICQCACHL